MERIKVGILGATGIVGQRLVSLLADHPWFEISELAASDRSSGATYGDVVHWLLPTPPPERIKRLVIKDCIPTLDCRIVFSGLPGDVARTVEIEFAKSGYVVSSNASAYRMDPDIPLIIPEVNPDHLEIIYHQKRQRGFERGFIVTNPNCSAIQLVLALKPLADRFGIRKVMVTTLQAISGAGYPGVASLDIVDNVIPFINSEEEKMEAETQKLLGSLKGNEFVPAPIDVSAQCNRVPTVDGHLECVSVALEKKVSPDEVKSALATFTALPQKLKLPTAPEHPIVVFEEKDRPQPRLDRELEKGMAACVGRIRKCSVLDCKMVVLGHNAIRGAAGAAVLNAELLVARDFIL